MGYTDQYLLSQDEKILREFMEVLIFSRHTFDILVDIFDYAGECGHVLFCKRHAQIVADEVVPGLKHWRGDEVENRGG